MARPEVPDTSVLIHISRRRGAWPLLNRAIASRRVWLSAVAIAELYAGTRSREDGMLLDRISAAAQRSGRILTPTPSDWALAGRLIARHVRLRGPVRPRDHLADVLILVSAARLGGTVVTANVRHFQVWAGLATSAGLDVAVRPHEPESDSG
ncbi:MAG: type II toxin-antitoxin system VapC family toxin [Chloroflexota bacterium]